MPQYIFMGGKSAGPVTDVVQWAVLRYNAHPTLCPPAAGVKRKSNTILRHLRHKFLKTSVLNSLNENVEDLTY